MSITKKSKIDPNWSVTAYPATEYKNGAGYYLHRSGKKEPQKVTVSTGHAYSAIEAKLSGASEETISELCNLGKFLTWGITP